MNTKLTLKLEQEIIERAKTYAKAHRTSLSKLIEIIFLILPITVKQKKIK